MFPIAWSLALGIIATQLSSIQPPNPFPREAVKLYRQASILAESETPDLAYTVLEQLCQEYPQSPLAAISALRVVASKCMSHDFDAALEALLTTIGSQHETAFADVQAIDTEFESHLRAALQRIVANPENAKSVNRLHEWLRVTTSKSQTKPATNVESNEIASNGSSPSSLISTAKSKSPSTSTILQRLVLDQLSLHHARSGRFREAIELLDQSSTPLTEAQQNAAKFDLPLAMLKSQASNDEMDWLFKRLKNADLHSRKGIALCLAVGEAQRLRGDTLTAIETFSDLSQHLQKLIVDRTQPTSVQSPTSTQTIELASTQELADWLATARLRQAELLLLSQQILAARKILQAALNDFPKYTSLNQFRFLLARCQIAQVEFDEARQCLNGIIESKDSNLAADTAQAWWMLGEVDFLQRKYRDALQKYEQVLLLPTSTIWHARGLLQAAKCYELLGSPVDALSLYQRIVDQYPQSEVAETAQLRTQQLINAEASGKSQALNPTTTSSTLSR